MPITTSAKKALRVSARKKLVNDRRRKALKTALKKIKTLVTEKKAAEARKELPSVYQAIDKAVKGNILKPNAGSRTKSRISKLVKNAK